MGISLPLFPDSNWNLEMLVFVEKGKPEYLAKNPRSKDENQQQTQPTWDARSKIWIWAVLAQGGESSRHCTISAPLIIVNGIIKNNNK